MRMALSCSSWTSTRQSSAVASVRIPISLRSRHLPTSLGRRLSLLSGVPRATAASSARAEPEAIAERFPTAHDVQLIEELYVEKLNENCRREPHSAAFLQERRVAEGKQGLHDVLRAPLAPVNIVKGGSPKNSKRYLDPTYLKAFTPHFWDLKLENPRAFLHSMLAGFEMDKPKVSTETQNVKNEAEAQLVFVCEVVKRHKLVMRVWGLPLDFTLQRGTVNIFPDVTILANGRKAMQAEVKGPAVFKRAKGSLCESAQNNGAALPGVSQLYYSLSVTGVRYGCLFGCERSCIVKRKDGIAFVSRDIMYNDPDLNLPEALAYCVLKDFDDFLRSPSSGPDSPWFGVSMPISSLKKLKSKKDGVVSLEEASIAQVRGVKKTGAKASSTMAGSVKAGSVKTGSAKAGAAKASSTKSGAAKVGGVEADSTKAGDVKADIIGAGDAQAGTFAVETATGSKPRKQAVRKPRGAPACAALSPARPQRNTTCRSMFGQALRRSLVCAGLAALGHMCVSSARGGSRLSGPY